MKKFVFVVVVIAVIATVWFVAFGPSTEPAAEPESETEVAVSVGEITRSTLRGYVTVYGEVVPEPAGERPSAGAAIAPSVPGVVVAVNAVEGQRVAGGDVLFQLDSRAADVAVNFAEQAAARQRSLIQFGGTSDTALQDAEQQLDVARVQRELLSIQSPLAGTIMRVNVAPGTAVDLTSVLAEIVDLDRLVVTGSVPSAELEGLEIGQPAEVLVSDSAPPLAGSLTFISPWVEATTGAAEVRVALPSGSRLRPGQLVTMRIVSQEHANSLAVPIASIVKDEDGQTVVAIVENGTATQRPVTTGLRDGGLVEIEAEGLRPGMTVVTEGAYGLPESTLVRIIEN